MPVEKFSNSNCQWLLDMTSLTPSTHCSLSSPHRLTSWAYRSTPKPVNSIYHILMPARIQGPSPSVRKACVKAGGQQRKRSHWSRVGAAAGEVRSEGSGGTSPRLQVTSEMSPVGCCRHLRVLKLLLTQILGLQIPHSALRSTISI